MKHLIIMSGIPGSGKSTYIEKNLTNYQVISSDLIRKAITGSYSDFSREPEIWSIVEKQLHNPSKDYVVLDSTALTKERRKILVGKYQCRYKKISLIQMNTPEEICIKRVENRSEKRINREDMQYFTDRYEPYTSKERGLFHDVRIINYESE